VTARLVLENLTLGIVLVCFTVLVQVWLSLFVVRLFRRFAPSVGSRSSFPIRVVAVTVLVLTILLGHLGQVYIWALVFYLLAFFNDFWSAQYFVGETYRHSVMAICCCRPSAACLPAGSRSPDC
jgi:hypothetical protein